MDGRMTTHGSLAVPARAERAYESAKTYLCRDAAERRLFALLEGSHSRHFRLTIDARDDDYFDPNTDTIAWDPHSALRTTQGGGQSPALGLGHEIAHAVEASRREAKLACETDRTYDNQEERRVIRGSEARAARTLGEAVRYDHDGTCYRVRSPIAR
jgi:hypothetical protein